MKRELLVGIIGLAASAGVATSASAQGSVIFSNYGYTTFAPITYGVGSGGTVGAGVNNSFTAGLWYFLGTASLATGAGDLSPGWEVASITQQINSGATAGPAGVGLFVGGAAQMPDYVSGPITFIVTAYNGSSYNSATLRAHSAAFTLPSISTGPSPVGEFGPGFTSFSIPAIPEPSIFAFSGLGAGALMLIRRKK